MSLVGSARQRQSERTAGVCEMKLTVESRTITISSSDKMYFPETDQSRAITKGEVCEYYARIAPQMFPVLEGRAIGMHRYPDGIDGKEFFQHNAPKSWA